MNEPSTASGPIAFDRLLDQKERVFRVCMGFSSSYEEAEDLAQDVYLKAYQSYGTLDRPELATYWLLRIAKNTGLDRQKMRRRRGELLRSWAETALPAVTRGNDPAPEANAKLDAVKAAIRRLPGRFREVFVLREYGRLSYEEIARTLGIETGTVMSRLARSRKKVAEAIEGRSR